MTTPTHGVAPTLVQELLRAEQHGPPVVACTVLTSGAGGPAVGAKMLVRPDGATVGSLGGGALEQAAIQAALELLPRQFVGTVAFTPAGARLDGRRAMAATAQVVELLLEVVEPPATLLVVGGGHVGLAIARLGDFLGMSVAVLDDRAEFANAGRFPFADQILCGDFAAELDRFPITRNTYLVLVTRGHKQDEISLRHVVGRGARYVGMIGSQRRTGAVLRHLAEEGVPAAGLAQVFTPIGLDIGAETPEEIAVSVLAEIILVQQGGGALPLSPAGRAAVGGPPAAPPDPYNGPVS